MSNKPPLRWILLAAVLFLNALFIIGAFDPSPHTGGDNAGYISLAYSLVTTGSYMELFDPAGLSHTKYPPVFPAILAVLMWLGARTWIAFKGVSVVATLAASGFTYLWAERRLGSRAAFLVALLLGVSVSVIYHSHWILSDPVFFAFTMAAMWALECYESDESSSTGFLFLGVAAVGLAYFTRSAGLPLVVALIGWLFLKKRWRPLGVSAFVLGIPMLWWWARGLGTEVSYADEFWMVNPYDPSQGTIELMGLGSRMLTNLTSYMFNWGPYGLIGSRGTWVAILGIVLTLAMIYGWLNQVRDRIRPAELFVPAYAALILLWPEVWAGDRFVLPLYPFVLMYGFAALRDVLSRLPVIGGRAITGAVILALFVPPVTSWIENVRWASTCTGLVRTGGAFACWGPRMAAYVEAAEWAGRALPAGSVVMSRKPRHFYTVSGLPSRTFSFDTDPDVQIEDATSVGGRYVLLDQWDGLAGRYIGGAILDRPSAFCFVQRFGDRSTGGADILGIISTSRPSVGSSLSADEVRLALCPPDYHRAVVESNSARSSSLRIPLLDGLDS